MDGDGKVEWADSKLTEHGAEQAHELARLWSDAVQNEDMPLPQSLYTSPLARTLETTRLVFEKNFQNQGLDFRPIVKKLLRERLTDHTCDRRRSRSWIETNYPNYNIESGFSSEDTLWSTGPWETDDDHAARMEKVLEEIFSTDDNPFVGFTTHSYTISAILQAVGLFQFRVREGSTIALLVRAERVYSNLETTKA